MENYADFFCNECRYYTELYDKKHDEHRAWCDKDGKSTLPKCSGCENFELEEDSKL